MPLVAFLSLFMLLLAVVAMVSIVQCFPFCGAAEHEFVTAQGGGALEGGENCIKCIKRASLRKGRIKQTGTNKVKVCLGLLMENSTKLTHWDPQLSGEQWCRAQQGSGEDALLNEWSWDWDC